MANPYFSHSNQFLPGSLARGEAVDARLTALVTSFDANYVDMKRAIKVPTSITTDQVLPTSSADRANRFIGFDATGNVLIMATPTAITTPVIAPGDAGKFFKVDVAETGIDFSAVLTEASGAITIAGPLTTSGDLRVNANIGIGRDPVTDLDVIGEIRASTGILFGSDTAAANKLDDYEEGIFTPELWDSTNATATPTPPTYVTQVGQYTKIGDRVFFEITVTISAYGSLVTTDTARIGGLPFTAKTAGSSYPVSIADVNGMSLIAAGRSLNGRVTGNGSRVLLNIWDLTAGDSDLLISEFFSSGDIKISGVYATSA